VINLKKLLILVILISYLLLQAKTTSATITFSSQSPSNLTAVLLDQPSFSFTAQSSVDSTFSCTLYIDNIAYGTNSSVANNTVTTITANSTLSPNSHQWWINCTDTDGEFKSSTYTIYTGGQINWCAKLVDQGQYILTEDITNANHSNCMSIENDNITLDCQEHYVDCDGSARNGVYASYVSNITIRNCIISEWLSSGIYFDHVTKSRIENVTIRHILYPKPGDYGDGITLKTSTEITITNITSTDNRAGVHLFASTTNSTIFNSVFNNNIYGIHLGQDVTSINITSNVISSNNYGVQIYLAGETPNIIYNNIFNNTQNFMFPIYTVGDVIYQNYWNITKQVGNNIYNPFNGYIGGNVWSYPNGTGHSDTCTDADCDGFCDEPYPLNESSGNIDYLPIRAHNIPPIIHSVNISVYNLGSQHNTTLYVNVTDEDCNAELRYVCFRDTCTPASNIPTFIDIDDILYTNQNDFVYANDSFNSTDTYILFFNLTNNTYNESEDQDYLDVQYIQKQDLLCNYGDEVINYFINHSNIYSGTLETKPYIYGSVDPNKCQTLTTKWSGDWLNETIYSEQQDPNHPAIANSTIYTYIQMDINNTGVTFSNVSLTNVSLCRTGWQQNTTYVSVSEGMNTVYIGCSKENVVVFDQYDHSLDIDGYDIYVDQTVNGHYNITIINTDNQLSYSTVFVETNIPSPYYNTSDYTFYVDLTPGQQINKTINISGIPVAELGKTLSLDSIPSYEKYTFTGQVRVYDDKVSSYNIIYAVPKSYLTGWENRTSSMDVYTVDGKTYGVVVTENSTHVIFNVTTEFTQSSLHYGDHNFVIEYYIYNLGIVSGGGGGAELEIPTMQVTPQELDLYIIYPNRCNETNITVEWTGNPQQATILITGDIKDIIKSPKSGEKIWLNRETVIPIKACIPEEYGQNIRTVLLKSWQGYIEITSTGTYGAVTQKSLVTVKYAIKHEVLKPQLKPEKPKIGDVLVVIGIILLIVAMII